MERCEFFSNSEFETIELARMLACFSVISCNIYLRSDVGLGKTCFCRGFLRGLGYFGVVRSPSYSLVESYIFADFTVYHFDFYRLHDPEELEYIGIRDYFNAHSLCLVEWPNLVTNILPMEDISINLEYYQLSFVRKIIFQPLSALGKSILEQVLIYYHGNIRIC